MANDFLSDRKKGLEDAFFAEQDAILRRKLGQADQEKARRESLAAASGIHDPAVLDKLSSLGVSGETVLALSLAPLVLVAWADGEIDQKERAAVLSGAEQAGLAKDAPGHELLQGWLNKPPSPELLASWKAYVAALSPSLDEAARSALRREILSRARSVAEQAGGFLGLGPKVSDAEQAVLTDLERSFSG